MYREPRNSSVVLDTEIFVAENGKASDKQSQKQTKVRLKVNNCRRMTATSICRHLFWMAVSGSESAGKRCLWILAGGWACRGRSWGRSRTTSGAAWIPGGRHPRYLATHLLHYCFSIVLLYSITGNTPSALLLQYCALFYHWQHTFCVTASVLCFILSLATHLLHYCFSIVLYSITGNTPSALLLQYCASLLYHWQHTFCVTASVLCFILSLATHLLHYCFSIVLLYSITGNTPSALLLQYCALFYHWQHTFCITASVLCFSTLSLATHLLHYCFSIVLYSITGNTPSALLLQYCASLLYHWFSPDITLYHWRGSKHQLTSITGNKFLHYCFSIVLLSSITGNTLSALLLQHCTSFYLSESLATQLLH